MTATTPALPAARPEELGASSLIGISTSLKGVATDGRSAARALLVEALGVLQATYPAVSILDLRDHPLPLFDGRLPHEHESGSLTFLSACIERAGALLISAPAYWAGVSGVFKNFIDVLCGPAYDLPAPKRTVFGAKPVGVLVVGADQQSARLGAQQARLILTSTGARVIDEPVVVSNPRSPATEAEINDVVARIVALAATLAREALLSSRGSP